MSRGTAVGTGHAKGPICRWFVAALVGSAVLVSTLVAAQNATVEPRIASASEDIAVASRILADLGVLDGFGHVSMRHPGRVDRFLMAHRIAPALVSAADILEFDLDGNPFGAQGRPVFLERFIHAEIYRRRSDVNAVVHTHSPGVIPFSVSTVPLRPLYHNAAFLGLGVPVFDIFEVAGGATDMLVRNNALGKALAETLADKAVVLMRGHGNVVVGPTIQVATFRAYYTEVNARLQAQAATLGGSIKFLTPEESTLADAVNVQVVERTWELWKNRLGRTN